MSLNISFPLLILNILIQEFNPEYNTYLVHPMNGTIDDHSIIEQIIFNINIRITTIQNLKFIPSYPNCIIIFEKGPNLFSDHKSLKRIRRCCVILLIGVGDHKKYLEQILTDRFTKVIAYTPANDTDAVRVILPDRDLSNYKTAGVPETVLCKSNYSKLQKMVKDTRMNVNGATFVASMFPKRFTAVYEKDGTITGFDGEMMKLIAVAINSTLKVLRADRILKYGSRLENGSYDGVLGDVFTRRADIASNAIFIKEYGSSDFLFTIPVQQEDLCIAVPSPLLVPNWKIVFRAFEPEVWMLTCFAVTVSILLWYVLNLIGRTRTTFCDAVFYIGRLTINPVKLPTGSWQRVFTFSVILLSSVMVPSFEGSLLKLLRQRSFQKEISTLSDFRDSEYTIYTSSSNLVEDSVPEYLSGRVKLYDGIDMGLDLLEMTGTYRNLSHLGKKCDILERSSTSNKVTLVKECPRAYHLAYMMRRGNLLFRAVDRVVSRIMASGLDQAPLISLQCGTNTRKEKAYTIPRPLQLSNMTIAIYILKMGYSMASATFVLELAVFYIIVVKSSARRMFRKIYCNKRKKKSCPLHPLTKTTINRAKAKALNTFINNSQNTSFIICKMQGRYETYKFS